MKISTDFKKWIIWIPGLFWLFLIFLILSYKDNELNDYLNKISFLHGLYSGIQFFVIATMLTKYLL